MKRIHILSMAAAMVALIAFAAVPAAIAQPPPFCPPGAIGNPSNPHFPFCPGAAGVGVGAAGVGVGAGEEGVPVASQEFSISRLTSGAANPVTNISNTGNNVNLCPTTQQVVNTGNVANEQGVVQYVSKVDDIDFTGSSITIDGASVTGTCTQTIEQAAAAG